VTSWADRLVELVGLGDGPDGVGAPPCRSCCWGSWRRPRPRRRAPRRCCPTRIVVARPDPGQRPAGPDDARREARPDDPGRAPGGHAGRRAGQPAGFDPVRRGLGAVAQQRHVVGQHVRRLPERGAAEPVGHPHHLRRRRGARPQQRGRRHDLPPQHRSGRHPQPDAGAADRPGHRRGGLGDRHRLGLLALPVRGPQRPLGPHLRVVQRGPGRRQLADDLRQRHAGLEPQRLGLGAGHRQALPRRRRHDRWRRPGQHPAQRGRPAGDPPAAVPGCGPAATSAR
jgi:hypothetical protein